MYIEHIGDSALVLTWSLVSATRSGGCFDKAQKRRRSWAWFNVIETIVTEKSIVQSIIVIENRGFFTRYFLRAREALVFDLQRVDSHYANFADVRYDMMGKTVNYSRIIKLYTNCSFGELKARFVRFSSVNIISLFAHKHRHIDIQWIPRYSNNRADYVSKMCDFNDYCV